MKESTSCPPAYLGDGVYASFDGYYIWLRTEREGSWHEIALEPEVYANLKEFVTKLRKMME